MCEFCVCLSFAPPLIYGILFFFCQSNRRSYRMMNSDVKEDLFDCILRLEDTHIQQGFDEGYEAGLVSGREDARHLGSRQASCSVSTKGVLPSGTLLISLFTCLLSSTSISMTSKPCSISSRSWIPRTKPRMILGTNHKSIN